MEKEKYCIYKGCNWSCSKKGHEFEAILIALFAPYISIILVVLKYLNLNTKNNNINQ